MRPFATVLLVLAACQAAPRPVPREIVVADALAMNDVTAWRGWRRMNPKRFLSKGHGYLWVDVYVDPARVEQYGALDTAPAAGFRVVMVGYDTETDSAARGLTVMAKMAAGYDPENGDWYYAALGPDGKRASAQGKLEPCIGCHRHAHPRDHLFGVQAGE